MRGGMLGGEGESGDAREVWDNPSFGKEALVPGAEERRYGFGAESAASMCNLCENGS